MAEMTWRKMPRNIIRDENLLYISEKLPKELSFTPWMFYYTALSLADDDGIFDLEDGIVFSRLMKVDDPQIVFYIANLLMQRNLILRSNQGSSKCILVNWDYKDTEKRTMDQRRQVVQRQIEEDRKRKAQQVSFNPIYESEDCNLFSIDLSKKTPSDVFLCPQNDKTVESVDKNINVDKKLNFVDKTEREKERQIEILDRDILEREKETHTEKQQFQDPPKSLHCCTEESTEIKKENDEIDRAADDVWDSQSLVDQALTIGQPKVGEDKLRTYSIFNDFFVKNCLGFKDSEHKKAMNELVRRVSELADAKNPPDVIAIQFIGEYKKLCTENEYYQGMPILPEYLIKNGVYSHVLASVSRYLLNQTSDKTAWEEQAKQYYEEVQAEKNSGVGNGLDNEYIQFDIDPTDPNRVQKLMIAKAQHQENNPP